MLREFCEDIKKMRQRERERERESEKKRERRAHIFGNWFCSKNVRNPFEMPMLLCFYAF